MANKWTKEQLDAINLDNTNIIVSAGAGSGKTAVLSERVLRKINQGIHINQILILTFTNAAAKEMKDRIRNKLIEAKKLDEANLIDSSYITTFDSFSLSIVKKYHTLLNISSDIAITDSSLLYLKKIDILNEILTNYYENPSDKFKIFIKNFCYKDDDDLKKILINLNDKLDMKYNKTTYLEEYINNYYSEEFIIKCINQYFQEIERLISKIKDVVKTLNLYMDFDYIIKLESKLKKLYQATTYDEVVNSLDFRLPNLPINQEDEVKSLKNQLSSYLKDIKALCIYENEQEIKKELLGTMDNTKLIIDIIKEFDTKFTEFKLNNNMFDFIDINKLAIKLVSDFPDIREELKFNFKEIMIDEYQDTNDIGEYFISLISNNNVYMVGDIKQSIYRFRNANPYIFKNKYDLYTNNTNGIKIDLLKNFRSREEVLKAINLIFNDLMTDSVGGADYKLTHQMIFGNKLYQETGKTKQNYDLKILTYQLDKEFTNNEKEMFIIANDIKEKIESNYQIFDKEKEILRKIQYNDCVILLDRATDFDNYKKVFEYFGIPLSLYKDEELKNEDDILVIRNLLKLINYIDLESYNKEFKYAFLSIGRSFLFNINDDILFDYITNDTYKESIIYKKLEEAYNYYYELSLKMFLIKLCEIFNYEESLLKVGNIKRGLIRLEYFYNLIDEFALTGKTLQDFIDYLDHIFELDNKVTFSINSNETNSVKLMTIHKSKGLEFPICYFTGFTKEFSTRELNDNILYSNTYGIISPYFNDYSKPTILKTLLNLETKQEDLSEKIRLFYVALTRAKEKMIMVIPEVNEETLDSNKIKSFYDMIKYVYPKLEKFMTPIQVNCTKDYLYNLKKNNLLTTESDNFEIKEFNFNQIEIIEEKYSKTSNQLVSKTEADNMKYGTKIHEILQFIDFNNPDYSNIDIKIVSKIKKFIESDIIQKNLNHKFYKEYEFNYEDNQIIKKGIIDLMIENDKEIIIIDYKLKNTNDSAYKKQLLGYYQVISKLSNKQVKTYLYSIIDEKFTLVNELIKS